MGDTTVPSAARSAEASSIARFSINRARAGIFKTGQQSYRGSKTQSAASRRWRCHPRRDRKRDGNSARSQRTAGNMGRATGLNPDICRPVLRDSLSAKFAAVPSNLAAGAIAPIVSPWARNHQRHRPVDRNLQSQSAERRPIRLQNALSKSRSKAA